MCDEGGQEIQVERAPRVLDTIYRVHHTALRNTVDLANLLKHPEFFYKSPEERIPLKASDLVRWPKLKEKLESLEDNFRIRKEHGLIPEGDNERLHYDRVIAPFDPRRANTVAKVFYAASEFVDMGKTALETEDRLAVNYARGRLGNEDYEHYVNEYKRLKEIVSSKKSPHVETRAVEMTNTETIEESAIEEQRKLDYEARAKREPLTEEELSDIYQLGRKTLEVYESIGGEIE